MIYLWSTSCMAHVSLWSGSDLSMVYLLAWLFSVSGLALVYLWSCFDLSLVYILPRSVSLWSEFSHAVAREVDLTRLKSDSDQT